jgi:hypothetical protein
MKQKRRTTEVPVINQKEQTERAIVIKPIKKLKEELEKIFENDSNKSGN